MLYHGITRGICNRSFLIREYLVQLVLRVFNPAGAYCPMSLLDVSAMSADTYSMALGLQGLLLSCISDLCHSFEASKAGPSRTSAVVLCKEAEPTRILTTASALPIRTDRKRKRSVWHMEHPKHRQEDKLRVPSDPRVHHTKLIASTSSFYAHRGSLI